MLPAASVKLPLPLAVSAAPPPANALSWVNDRLPETVPSVRPAPPTGLPASPMAVVPPLTCCTPAVISLASKVTLLIVIPLPTVLPLTVLPLSERRVVLATAPPLTTIAVAEETTLLPLTSSTNVPAARLMSSPLPVEAVQVLFWMLTILEPVVPALRLTSMPSVVAAAMVLPSMTSWDAPLSAAAVVTSMALPLVDAIESPRISAGSAAVARTVSAALVSTGRVPGGDEHGG